MKNLCMKPIILLMLAGLFLYWLVYNSEVLANANRPKQAVLHNIELSADMPLSLLHWQQ